MQLRFLHVSGPNTEPANADFLPGLNVINGPSNTGKSHILRLIDYVLGAQNPPEPIAEQALYDLVHLGVAMDDGSEKTLVRALQGGEIRIIDGLIKARPEPKQGVSVSARHSAKVSLSKILLEQLGAAGARIQTKAAGATRDLSFRDLDSYALFNETKIQAETSPVLSGQYILKPAETAVFKYILTGVDDSARNCSRCGELGVAEEPEHGSDGLERADRLSASGFNDGSDVGVLLGAPLGAESIGDFSIGGAGAQGALGFVVGRGNGAVGHEDEEVGAEFFDCGFPFDPRAMDGGQVHHPVEFGFETSFVNSAGGVVPFVAPLGFVASQADEVAKGRREDAVALLDDILGVTQEMGEADLLVVGGPAGLGAVAIGDPHLRANVAEELLDRLLGASGMGQEEGVLTVMEDPQPPASLANPQAGLVGTDHGSFQQSGADVGAGGGEAFARLAQDVDQRAFADEKAEQIAHQARQALESDALGEAQIDDQRPQVGAERRAGLEPRRRLRLEAPGAAGTDACVQAHPRDLGGDRGNLDPVVDLARGLRALRNVGPAMPADIRQNVAPLLIEQFELRRLAHGLRGFGLGHIQRRGNCSPLSLMVFGGIDSGIVV
jgi:hypothetical protein